MTAHCAACRQQLHVRRYRMADIGERALCEHCHEWLTAMGLDFVEVDGRRERLRGMGA